MFSPEVVSQDEIEPAEPAPVRSRRISSTSFKDLFDFIDRKEAEIKELFKRKNSIENSRSQGSRSYSLDKELSSPA
ncbi:unnamed protein product [Amaranthus hypochondriacus]